MSYKEQKAANTGGKGFQSKSYRDLEIYQLSYKLAMKIHHMSLKFPKYELYEEGSQIRRSSKGVCACIVEGYGRRKYKKDFVKYLVYQVMQLNCIWNLSMRLWICQRSNV